MPGIAAEDVNLEGWLQITNKLAQPNFVGLNKHSQSKLSEKTSAAIAAHTKCRAHLLFSSIRYLWRTLCITSALGLWPIL